MPGLVWTPEARSPSAGAWCAPTPKPPIASAGRPAREPEPEAAPPQPHGLGAGAWLWSAAAFLAGVGLMVLVGHLGPEPSESDTLSESPRTTAGVSRTTAERRVAAPVTTQPPAPVAPVAVEPSTDLPVPRLEPQGPTVAAIEVKASPARSTQRKAERRKPKRTRRRHTATPQSTAFADLKDPFGR